MVPARLGLRLGNVWPSVSRALLFPKDSAHDEAEVGRTFAQPPHEVGEPFASEGDVQPYSISVGDKCPLQVTADSIQHLELEAVLADAISPRVGPGRLDHRRVGGGQCQG